MFALISSLVGFSQQVTWVETKLAVYNGKIYDDNKTEWFGYSFCNRERKYVFVEAELYMIYYRQKDSSVCMMDAILIDTKTFVLDPNETYIWKQEHNSDFKKNDKGYPHGDDYCGKAIRYYVQFRAYSSY